MLGSCYDVHMGRNKSPCSIPRPSTPLLASDDIWQPRPQPAVHAQALGPLLHHQPEPWCVRGTPGPQTKQSLWAKRERGRKRGGGERKLSTLQMLWFCVCVCVPLSLSLCLCVFLCEAFTVVVIQNPRPAHCTVHCRLCCRRQEPPRRVGCALHQRERQDQRGCGAHLQAILFRPISPRGLCWTTGAQMQRLCLSVCLSVCVSAALVCPINISRWKDQGDTCVC